MEQKAIKVIEFDEVEKLTRSQIRTRLGKSTKTLIDKYGMNEQDARNFVANIMRLTLADNRRREELI